MVNNATILNVLGKDVAREVCNSMAQHYRITPAEAQAELTHPDAYPLLEYLTEPARTATYLLMQRHDLI